MDDASERPPNVLLMIGMSLALWGLVSVGILSVWPRQVSRPETASRQHSAPPPAMPRHALPQLVSTAGQSLMERPGKAKVKVVRKRRWGPVLAARVFKTSMH